MPRALYLALTLASMATLASPQHVFEMLGWNPPISHDMARMIAFALMFWFFALFSGPSKFGASDAIAPPPAPVDHLLPSVPAEIAARLPDREVLRQVVALMVEKRKIDAIKTVRLATQMGLKDAKEYVERLQASISHPLG
jgi:hypothetical protein